VYLNVVLLAGRSRPKHRGRRMRIGGFGFATMIAAATAPHASVAVLDFVNFNLALRAVARKSFSHRNFGRRVHFFDSTEWATGRVDCTTRAMFDDHSRAVRGDERGDDG
jgi:hypothetical protein